jgi:hypothetical protein
MPSHVEALRRHPFIGFSLRMWLAMHEYPRASRRARLLFDHLAGELRDYARLTAPASA